MKLYEYNEHRSQQLIIPIIKLPDPIINNVWHSGLSSGPVMESTSIGQPEFDLYADPTTIPPDILNPPNLPINCCVPQCLNGGIFPCPPDGPLRRKWRKAIRRADLKYGLQWRPTDEDYICESHFTEHDILLEESDQQGEVVKMLKPGAIPSLFSRTSTIDNNDRILREMSKLSVKNQDEFLENWTPESSNRETRKLTRKIYNQGYRKMNRYYDSAGLLRSNGKDICDCLNNECPGCYFPCPKCESPKCGHECRCDRRWVYDHVEIDGVSGITRNINR